jgi:two-component system, NtrC family, response regulator PilR
VNAFRFETDLRPTALIVDDEPSVREILKLILQREGWIVQTAEDGDDAIRKLEGSTYRVVLLDLLMPRVGGAGVIDFIKERGITTPVVVISSAADRTALDPQIVRVALPKPLEIRDLRDVLRAILDARQHAPA